MQGQSPNPYFLMPCKVYDDYDGIEPIELPYKIDIPPKKWSQAELALMTERYEQSMLGQKPHVISFAGDVNKALLKFGIDPDRMVKCPLCTFTTNVYSMIIHLNDTEIQTDLVVSNPRHGQSFKFIGEWLKSIGY